VAGDRAPADRVGPLPLNLDGQNQELPPHVGLIELS
jgi:hypothetical protein